MKKVKSLTRPESVKAHIDFLRNSGFPYSLKISNYTIEIISELYTVQFLQSMRGKQCFAAYSKVKSDVKVFTPPRINRADLRYFEHDFTEDFFEPYVINVDIKSAYATMLYNKKYISRDTFRYLSRIDKLDRLASVGMLASKKYCFDYDKNNTLLNYDKIVSELEDFFYYCVIETDKIMKNLKNISYSRYLFTWVDGIYFKPDEEILFGIEDYMRQQNVKWSTTILEQFRVVNKGKKIQVTFWKPGESEDGFDCYDLKRFYVPARSNMLAEDLVNYLTYQNVRQDETGNSKALIALSGKIRKALRNK